MSANHCSSGLSVIHQEKEKVYQIKAALEWKHQQIARYFLFRNAVSKRDVFRSWAHVPHHRKQRLREILTMWYRMDLRSKSEKMRISFRAWVTVLRELQQQDLFHERLEAASEHAVNVPRIIEIFLGKDEQLRLRRLAFFVWKHTAGESKHVLRAAASLFTNNERHLRCSFFWTWCNLASHGKAADMQNFTLQKAAALLHGNRKAANLSQTLAAWARVRQESKQVNFKQESARKAVLALIGNQSRLLIDNVFLGWTQLLSDLISQRNEHAKLLKIFSNQSWQSLCKEALLGWTRFLDMSRRKKQHQKQAIHVLVGSNSTMLLRNFLQGWHRFTREEHSKREQRYAAAQAQEHRLEVAQRSIQRLAGNTREVLMANVLSAWSKPLVALRKGRKAAGAFMENQGKLFNVQILLSWRRQVACAKQEILQQEHLRKMMGMILGNQSTTSLSTSMFGWIRVVQEAKQDILQANLQQELLQQSKARNLHQERLRESTHKILGSLANGQARFCMKTVLDAWIQLHEAFKSKLQRSHHVLQMFWGSQRRLLLTGSLHGWQKAVSEGRVGRHRSSVRERHVDALRRSVQKVFANSMGVVLHNVFSTWKHQMHLTKQDFLEMRRYKISHMLDFATKTSARQTESLRRMSLMFVHAEEACLTTTVFALWQCGVAFQRARELSQVALDGCERREREWRLTVQSFQHRLVAADCAVKLCLYVRHCLDSWISCMMPRWRLRWFEDAARKGFLQRSLRCSWDEQIPETVAGAIVWAQRPYQVQSNLERPHHVDWTCDNDPVWPYHVHQFQHRLPSDPSPRTRSTSTGS